MGSSLKSSRKSIIVSFLLLFFLVSAVFASPIEEKRSELNQVNNELRKAQEKLEALKKQEQNISTQIRELDSQINLVQSEINSLGARIYFKQAQIRKREEKINLLQKSIDQKIAQIMAYQEKLKSQTKALNKRLVQIYTGGDYEYLDVLLGAHSFSELISRLTLYSYIVKSDRNLIEEIKQTKALLSERKAELESQKEQVFLEKVRLQGELNQLNEIKNERLAKRSFIQKALSYKQSNLSRVLKNKTEVARLEAELEKTSRYLTSLIRRLESQSSSGSRPANFIWPVNGTVTSYFGWRIHPILKVKKFHTGIDIAASYGTDIKASAGGKIIFAGWLGGYGNTVIIDHGGGYSSLYAHASAIIVSEDEEVSQGQVIARVGSTGYSTGPHLHFEVRVNGEPQNPLNYL